MSDSEFDQLAESDPNAALASGDTRVVSSARAFNACARVAGRWALENHSVRLLEFPELAMETVAGHPRWWFNDFANEVYEEAEDERTREALSILNDVHMHYMSDYEDIVENAQSEAQLLVRMTEFSQRLASEVGVSEEATAPATRRDMRIAGVTNRGSAGGKDLDL